MTKSKRYVEDLKAFYACIFADAMAAFPTLGDEFERDLARLLNLADHRGLHTFCVDLPAVGKHFDKCLSMGQYQPSGLPLTKRYTGGVVIPKFLRGLYLLVFDEIGHLKEEYNELAIIFIRQILFAAKKLEISCDVENVRTEVRQFFDTDAECPEPEGFWTDPEATAEDIRCCYSGFSNSRLFVSNAEEILDGDYSTASRLLGNMDTLSILLNSLLGTYSFTEWSFRHGPGAISERTGPTNKYWWSNWSERLENVYPVADCGFHSYSAWADRVQSNDGVGSSEPHSRLVDVPKTPIRPRLIAAEPSEHMWCQQNVWHYFCTRVARSEIGEFVRFRDQTFNQELARRGSRTQRLATLDLSEASDRVSCHFVGQLFRTNAALLMALQATRTHCVRQNYLPEMEEVVELRKFSTMGNACTFPVESLGFLCICLAAVFTTRNLKVNLKNLRDLYGEVAVFGDDLVVPTDSRLLVTQALEIFGFKVNNAKSFWVGKFRESCGVDAYNGVDVSPTYYGGPCDNKPESVASTVEISNNFAKKWMFHTARYLETAIKDVRIPYVSMDSGVLGFTCYAKPLLSSYKTRYNEFLHRWEALVPVIQSRSSKTPIENDSALLQFFTEDPELHIEWSSGYPQRPSMKIRTRWVPTQDLTPSLE